jgi:ribosomal protein L40E
MTAHDDTPDTLPCSRCGESIPADAERCPLCGYQPGGRSKGAVRLGEYAFIAAAVVSAAVFVVGVAGSVLELPVGPLSRIAIVTPYTAGVSGFFAYYLHRKRDSTPTDDDTLG